MCIAEKNNNALHRFEKVRQGIDRLVVPKIVFVEFFVNILRRSKQKLYEPIVKEFKRDPNIEIVDLDDDIIELAAKLKNSTGMPLIDCIIYATGETRGCKEIVSKDKHFDKIEKRTKCAMKTKAFNP